jgi:hypothetical protein
VRRDAGSCGSGLQRTGGDRGLTATGSHLLAMTVDTEADNQWGRGIPLTTANVAYWEPFQRICRRHGFIPTYLLTSEIVDDPAARSLLRSWVASGDAEVGAHLHPWTTPPFLDEPGFSHNDTAHAFISELPIDLARAKLEYLTEQIEEKIGVSPTSFRAGRYGLNTELAAALRELGYVVDSSVTPLTSWTGHRGLPSGSGGPDFSAHSSEPFFIEGTGDPGLLEIPVTVTATWSLLRKHPRLVRKYSRCIPVRGLRRLTGRRWPPSQPVWLHPAHFHYSQEDLRRACLAQVRAHGVAIMMVHSSELMPGGSPRTPTVRAAQKVLDRLDSFFEYVRSRGVRGATLSGAAANVLSRGSLSTRRL